MIKRTYRVRWGLRSWQTEFGNPQARQDWHSPSGFLNYMFGSYHGPGNTQWGAPGSPAPPDLILDSCVGGVWTGNYRGSPFTITDVELAAACGDVLGSAPVTVGP